MKLEELLGEELYAQVQAKLEAVNKDEPDKLKHVRYADLSEGGYVSKQKYQDLEDTLTGWRRRADPRFWKTPKNPNEINRAA